MSLPLYGSLRLSGFGSVEATHGPFAEGKRDHRQQSKPGDEERGDKQNVVEHGALLWPFSLLGADEIVYCFHHISMRRAFLSVVRCIVGAKTLHLPIQFSMHEIGEFMEPPLGGRGNPYRWDQLMGKAVDFKEWKKISVT